MNHHPLAVYVVDGQVGRFCTACASGIERHQQDAVKGCIRGFNRPCDFFLTEYTWKVHTLFG
jgi:hypothetical protein